MSLMSKDLVRVLGSTAIAIVLSSGTVYAEPGVDSAAYSYTGGEEETLPTGKENLTAKTTVDGKRAWGIVVSKHGPSDPSTLTVNNATIETSGEGRAHGIQSGDSRNDGKDGSIINLNGMVKVTTGGHDSFGLHAIDGSTINAEAGTVVETTGKTAFGAFAEADSTILLNGSTITTTGDNASGVVANDDTKDGAVGGHVILNNATITTGGSWAHGVYADKTGQIEVNGGTVTTEGERAYGLLATKNSNIEATDVSISTKEHHAHGVQAGGNGSNPTGDDGSEITLNNGTINTLGADSFGLHAIDGSSITANGTTIITKGENGFGAFAESFSAIELDGVKIETHGPSGHGLVANNDMHADGKAGVLTAKDTNVTTYKAKSYGAHAKDQGQIIVDGGDIRTEGERSYGLLAENNSTISSSAEINTQGESAHGVQAGANGNVPGGGDNSIITLENGSVVITEGYKADGLHAIEGGSINGTTLVFTDGEDAYAAFAESNSSINLHNSRLSTEGKNAYAVIANNDLGVDAGKITVTDSLIDTEGEGASGVYVDNGGIATISGSVVTVTGANAAALEIQGSGTINVDSTTLDSKSGPTMLVGLSEQDHVADIKIGENTVVTGNNGVLLQVDRDGDGKDAEVNLTLADGSETSGDILDLDDKETGFIKLNIGKNAIYSGKIAGVKDLVATEGSDLTFEAGTDFAGDVTLETSSATHGGLIDKPITVGGDMTAAANSFMGGQLAYL